MINYVKETSCRFCEGELSNSIISLGKLYPSNFSTEDADPEDKIPLSLVDCKECGLVQLEHTVDRDELYHQYWYRSGLNDSMVRDLQDVVNHAEKYLEDGETVVDIGANDGTMLGLYSKDVYKIGIDPAKNVGNSEGHCDLFINDYFPTKQFPIDKKAKVITGIAMFYDLPVIKDFMQGIVDILTVGGVFIIQFTDLTTTLKINAFDNLVFEHLEYYTLLMLDKIAREFGLELIDVSYNMVNGGSLRVTLSRYGQYLPTMSIHKYLFEEYQYLQTDNLYMLAERIEKHKNIILGFIKDKDVAVMSASTKGNTLLQFFGVDSTMITHAAEINEEKFGLKTVGTNIPIISEEESLNDPPDYYLVLAWHFILNFVEKNTKYLEEGGSFIVPLPIPSLYTLKDGEIVYEELR